MQAPSTSRTKTGWLKKQGGSWKSWKKRYFVIEGTKLKYYKNEKDTVPKGVVNLELSSNIKATQIPKFKNKPAFQIQTPSRIYFCVSETTIQRDSWIEVLNAVLDDIHPKQNTEVVTADDFELMRVVGKGSFGKVMQVRMKKTGKIYAMKMLSKQHIVENNEIEHTMSERAILEKIHHPFLVNLNYSFQSEDKLYFILDFVNGGELFYHLQKEKKFEFNRARFYAAEILLALEALHNAGIIYRDLKPENLLLNSDGHICVTDFGLCKQGLNTPNDKTDTFCGTPEYLAPEILLGQGYGKGVDWWSFGSLLFEMLTGLPPFYSQDVQEMYRKIINDKINFPPYMNEVSKDLISRLLERNPEERLIDPNLMKRHKFFEGIDWELLYQKQIPPPYIPDVKDDADTSQIDPEFTSEAPSMSLDGDLEGTDGSVKADQQDFAGFTYVPK